MVSIDDLQKVVRGAFQEDHYLSPKIQDGRKST